MRSMIDDTISIRDAAQALQCHPSTLQRWVEDLIQVMPLAMRKGHDLPRRPVQAFPRPWMGVLEQAMRVKGLHPSRAAALQQALQPPAPNPPDPIQQVVSDMVRVQLEALLPDLLHAVLEKMLSEPLGELQQSVVEIHEKTTELAMDQRNLQEAVLLIPTMVWPKNHLRLSVSERRSLLEHHIVSNAQL